MVRLLGANKMKTVTEMVLEIQAEILNNELYPQRAAELLTKLSALMGNILEEIRVRDVEYNKVLLKHLESEEKANRAKIRAEVSPEYEAKRKAQNIRDVTEEMIRSLKYMLRAKEDEYRNSNF